MSSRLLLIVSWLHLSAASPLVALQVGFRGAATDSCRPPAVHRETDLTLGVGSLAGEYRLIVIGSHGASGDSAVVGRLTLVYTAAADPAKDDEDLRSPAWGWTDIELEKLGPVTLLYPPSSRDPKRPGVQALHHAADGSLTLVLGNAFGPDGSVARDAGVFFEVLEITTRGMRGRWRDGGRRTPLPGGYFCAERLATPPRNRE